MRQEVQQEADRGYRPAEPGMEAHVDGPGVVTMTIRLENVAEMYLAIKKLSTGTSKEYRSTVTKWVAWGKGVEFDQIGRADLRDFLDWGYDLCLIRSWLNG